MCKIGYKHSEETKEKLRQASIKNGNTPPNLKGIPLSKEHKEKIRDALIGRKFSDEWKAKLYRTTFKKGQSSWSKGKKLPERSGEKSPTWKGGITPINLKIRNSVEYKAWREAVFKRDNWACVWCGAKCGNGKNVILNADHIKPFSLFPELRLEVSNGRTLCKPCHKKTDTYCKNSKYVIMPAIPPQSEPVVEGENA